MATAAENLTELIAAAKQGDGSAREELFRWYRPYLRMKADGQIRLSLRKRGDESDLVQEVVLKAYKDFGQFKGNTEPELTAWMLTILSHTLSNFVRDHTNEKRDVEREQPLAVADASASISWSWEPSGNESTPSANVIRGEQALWLARCLEELPESQCRAVYLRHIQRWRLQDIADEMDRSLDATAGCIARGIRALRVKMLDGSDSRK